MANSFDFVDFPTTSPPTGSLTGHDRLHRDRYHGSLSLELTALTPVFIAAGITALGTDVNQPSVPLLKVMGQTAEGYPVLQGTSLKGCLRAVYETITHSNVGAKSQWVPEAIVPRTKMVRRHYDLFPAELVFGTLGFQGLVSIADAVGDRPLELGELPAMFQPKSGRGRKFYRHSAPATASGASAPQQADQSSEPSDDKSPSPIQQAPTGTIFTTTLRFTNLSLAQLGTFLIALGQDANHPFALKVGGGKGKGLGSVRVTRVTPNITTGASLTQARYLAYKPEAQDAGNFSLSTAMQAAHDELIQTDSLRRLQEILHYPEGTP